VEDDNVSTQKSKRPRIAKSFGDDNIVYLVDDTPSTIEEAYSSPDADFWKEAIRNEIDCHTWFWGQNRMHNIFGPGSIFHTYVDVTSVIYQKTMQQRRKESRVTLLHHLNHCIFNKYQNQSTSEITWALFHRKVTGTSLDSKLINVISEVFSISL
jgi:hypothetical protein